MKQTLPYLLLVIGIIIYCACGGNKSKSTEIIGKADTTRTTILYAHDWTNNDYRTVTAFRIISFTTKPVDTTEGKVISEWATDTAYYVPFFNPIIDSAKKILKRVDGKDSTRVEWGKLPRTPNDLLLIDYNRNWK